MYRIINRICNGRLSERIREKRKQIRPSRARTLISVSLVLLMLGAIGFSVYQVARHITSGLSTLRTQEIVDESYVGLDLYVFRDEEVLYAADSALVDYAVRNGEKVSVGTHLGTAYAAPAEGDAEAIQTLLNAYGERIALLQELSRLGTPADARAEAEAVDRAYLALLRAAEEGNLSAMGSFADRMLDGIGRYDILTGNTASAGTVDALRAERTALVAGLASPTVIETARGGYFYYDTDGYESVFPYASALTMSPTEFREMTTAAPDAVPADAVGKLVYSSAWYAAAYVSVDDPCLELFGDGTGTYRMICKDSADTVIPMELVRMEVDSAGVLLVFSSREMPAGFDFPRTFRAECVARSVSGYRIPAEALVSVTSEKTGEDVTGVYILSGNVVEFRKVRIRVRRDGYIIADTYEYVQALLDSYTEEEYAIATADGCQFLGLNDNILVSGNELYEGKMIG